MSMRALSVSECCICALQLCVALRVPSLLLPCVLYSCSPPSRPLTAPETERCGARWDVC
jgi:hypothetical protein